MEKYVDHITDISIKVGWIVIVAPFKQFKTIMEISYC